MHPFLFHFRCDFFRLCPLLKSCWRLHLAAIIIINMILSLTVTHSAGPQWKKEMREKNQLSLLFRLTYEFSLLFRNAHYLPFYWVSFSVGLYLFFSDLLQKHSTPEINDSAKHSFTNTNTRTKLNWESIYTRRNGFLFISPCHFCNWFILNSKKKIMYFDSIKRLLFPTLISFIIFAQLKVVFFSLSLRLCLLNETKVEFSF